MDYANRLEAAASKPPVTRELFEAWLAARELLDGKKSGDKETPGEQYVSAILKDAQQPVLFRTLALRMLRPDHPLLTPALISGLLQQPDESLKREVLRALILRPDSGAQSLLRTIARDDKVPMTLRALAVTGLGQSADVKETQAVLRETQAVPELRRESLRSLGERRPPE